MNQRQRGANQKVGLVAYRDSLFLPSFLGRFAADPRVTHVFILPGFLDKKRLIQFFASVTLYDIPWLFRHALLNAGLWLKSFFIGDRVAIFKGLRSVNEDLFSQIVETQDFDVLVCFNGAEIWSDHILTSAGQACLNVHLGDLPAYGGLSPVIHALCAGETELVLSVHRMEHKVDAGQVVARGLVRVRECNSILDAHRRLNALAPDMVVQALDSLRGQQNVVMTRRPKSGDAMQTRLFRRASLSAIRMARNRFKGSRARQCLDRHV